MQKSSHALKPFAKHIQTSRSGSRRYQRQCNPNLFVDVLECDLRNCRPALAQKRHADSAHVRRLSYVLVAGNRQCANRLIFERQPKECRCSKRASNRAKAYCKPPLKCVAPVNPGNCPAVGTATFFAL